MRATRRSPDALTESLVSGADVDVAENSSRTTTPGPDNKLLGLRAVGAHKEVKMFRKRRR